MEKEKDDIIHHLTGALVLHGAKHDLLCSVHSIGDTLSDEDVLIEVVGWVKGEREKIIEQINELTERLKFFDDYYKDYHG